MCARVCEGFNAGALGCVGLAVRGAAAAEVGWHEVTGVVVVGPQRPCGAFWRVLAIDLSSGSLLVVRGAFLDGFRVCWFSRKVSLLAIGA